MPRLSLVAATFLSASLLAAPTSAAQKNGAMAQDFKLTDMNGKTVQLSDYRGKTVVLEWHNPGCPFVQKHYDSGNMQATQAKSKKLGAVWLTINSGAAGKQGHLNGAEAQKLVTAQKIKSDKYLLDHKGVVGKAYAAKTTPHIYVVNPKGVLVYQGGIDDKPTANVADIKGATNYALAAVENIAAGVQVRTAQSRPYGCSIKYAN